MLICIGLNLSNLCNKLSYFGNKNLLCYLCSGFWNLTWKVLGTYPNLPKNWEITKHKNWKGTKFKIALKFKFWNQFKSYFFKKKKPKMRIRTLPMNFKTTLAIGIGGSS